jgi:tetratricopeptide (TPR) repeat protein
MPDRKALFRQIRESEEQGDTACVLLRCREFLAQSSDHGPAWHSLGNAYLELARYQEAEHAFRQALMHCPVEQRHIVWSGFGHLEAARGNRSESRVWFTKAHEAAPDKADYLVFIGSSYFKDGDHGQAELAHRRAIGCSDGCIDEAYFNLGGVYLALERFGEARECYLKALEIDPSYPLAKLRLRDLTVILGIDC